MSKQLPTNNFTWKKENQLNDFDLIYPHRLHDLHNDFPLACERKMINGVEKLIPNLNDKKNYVVHYQSLKLYERLGLKIDKIHRGITFEQHDWLKIYIHTNTDLRMAAKNDFEK